MYSGIGIIPGTDTGGGSEGGENGTHTNQGSNTNTGTGENTNTGGGDSQNQNATVRPSQNQDPGGGTLVGGKTDEDPLIYVVSGEEIAASFYQSDVTIQIYTNDRTKKIKYILTTTVPEISNELYPSGLVRELDIENGGTLTFTKDGEYTITAYAYDTAGNKSNPTIMWLKRQVGGSTTGGITVSIASGNEGANKWYTSNVTLRVLGTDTGSKKVKYRVRGVATSTGQIGDKEVTGVGMFDSDEVEITNGTTFRIVADGTYSITAYSYDAGGMRLSQSEVLTLKKDATKPTVKSFTGEQIPGQGFKVKVQAEDVGAGLTSNPYIYRYKESRSVEDYVSETSENAEKLYTGLNGQKTYDMYALITDEAGNIAITDTIARPSLWVSMGTAGEIYSEGARSYYRSETVELKFRGQDSNNVDIMKTTYQVLGTVDKAGSMLGNTVTQGQQLPTDEYQLGDKETRAISLQADGNWIVKVHNYNKEGKMVTTNVVEVTRDTTVPKITSFMIDTIDFETGSAVAEVTNTDFGLSGQATGGGFLYYAGTNCYPENVNTHEYTNITDANSTPSKLILKDKAGNTDEMEAKIKKFNFGFVGNAQSVRIPKGSYSLKLWGGKGGDATGNRSGEGGRGGYAVGNINFESDTVIFVGCGGNGSPGGNATWNGGGRGLTWWSDNSNNRGEGKSGSGGGGTHVALSDGQLQDVSENKLLMAVGGGGGAGNCYGTIGRSGLGGLNGSDGADVGGGKGGSYERRSSGAGGSTNVQTNDNSSNGGGYSGSWGRGGDGVMGWLDGYPPNPEQFCGASGGGGGGAFGRGEWW